MTTPEGPERHRWGEELPATPIQRAPAPDRQFGTPGMFARVTVFILMALAVFIVYMLTGQPDRDLLAGAKAGNVTLPPDYRLDLWLPTLLSLGVLSFLYLSIFIRGHSRVGRVGRTILSIWSAGLLASVATYWGLKQLMPQGRFEELIILPAMILALAIVLGIFSPAMRIWRLNVPDGEIWMLLDTADHLVDFIQSGVQWVRPIDGFMSYQQAGALNIEIDSEDFYTHDNFPFRVRAKVACLFKPTDADPALKEALRKISREGLESGLKTEVEFIIMNELMSQLRSNLRQPENFRNVLERIYQRIQDAVNSRSRLGIKLSPVDPINVTILPTRLVASASEQLIALEAGTGGTRKDDRLVAAGTELPDDRLLSDIVRLATKDGSLSIQFDPEGKVHFHLASGDEIEIGDSLRETLLRAAERVGKLVAPEPPASEQETGMVSSGKPAEARQLPAGETWEEVQVQEVEEPPLIFVEDEESEDQPPEVIDTEPKDGIYQPRPNPIVPEDLDEP